MRDTQYFAALALASSISALSLVLWPSNIKDGATQNQQCVFSCGYCHGGRYAVSSPPFSRQDATPNEDLGLVSISRPCRPLLAPTSMWYISTTPKVLSRVELVQLLPVVQLLVQLWQGQCRIELVEETQSHLVVRGGFSVQLVRNPVPNLASKFREPRLDT